MKWYGLNISKFCGILVSSNSPDTPVVNEPIFIAKIPAVNRVFKVLSNRYITEQFNIKTVKDTKTFAVTQRTADIERYNIIFNRSNRVFKVIQN